MVYKHKIRVSHILDDLDKGYIKGKDEYKQTLQMLDKEDFIEHFLEEFDEQSGSDATDESDESRVVEKDEF